MWPHKAKVWSLCLSGNYPYSGVEEDQQTTSYVGHFFLHRYHLSHHYYTQQISLQQVCSYLDQFNKKSILIGIMLSWVAHSSVQLFFSNMFCRFFKFEPAEKSLVESNLELCILLLSMYLGILVERQNSKSFRLKTVWVAGCTVQDVSLPLFIWTWFFAIRQFEILSLMNGFFPCLNLIFLFSVACKIQVWNRLKLQFIRPDTISNWRIAKIKFR